MDTKKVRRYSVTTVPDEACEEFTRSSCDCKTCVRMHLSILEWNTFVPKTALQKSMKKVVAKIEKDVRRRKKKIL